MKTVLFARVSSREQKEEGYSIQSQLRLLNDYASRKEFKISKVFAVPESARTSQERKAFKEMIEYVQKNNISNIICEKVDRITRNLKDAVIIDEWLHENPDNIIHFVKDSLTIHQNSRSNETLQWDIKVVLARQYSNNLSEEVRKGLDEKVLEGWFAGSKMRGYKSIRPDGQNRAIWVIDTSAESEAPFIKKACELYAFGDYSLQQLRQVMFEDGWKQKNGKPISKSMLALIVANPFYCGWFKWNGKIYKEAKHEPLITEEVHQIILDKMQRKGQAKYMKHNHLFKGLIKCGLCGHLITGDMKKGHIYYRCSQCRACGQRSYTREEALEKQILGEIGKFEIKNERMLNWLIKALKESHDDEIEYHNNALASLNTQYQKTQNRLDVIYIDKLDGNINADKYDELAERFRTEQDEIRQKLEQHQHANSKYFELGINLLEVAKQAGKIYQQGEVSQKRQLLRLTFSNLALKNKVLLTKAQKPFEIISQRVEKGNWSGHSDLNRESPRPKRGALAN